MADLRINQSTANYTFHEFHSPSMLTTNLHIQLFSQDDRLTTKKSNTTSQVESDPIGPAQALDAADFQHGTNSRLALKR
jgi:hypothetical protein